MSVCIIIPALNPDKTLVGYIERLTRHGLNKIIVVNDGSRLECEELFNEIKAKPECDVIVHTVNKGKGRALKDAFAFYWQNYHKQYAGVITVDSDGQHTVEDVMKLAAILDENSNALILGTRNFDGENVPWKSRMGNKTTTAVVQILWGKRINDTQTGLRGIPNQYLQEFSEIAGERFEYEMNMLLYCIAKKIPIIEETICTVYENNNAETHFNPIKDSIRIYGLILGTFFKYIVSSLSASIIDLLLFQFVLLLTAGAGLQGQILAATLIARIISSVYNYFMNARVVFKSDQKMVGTILKYYALAVVQMFCSWGFVYILVTRLALPKVLIKIIVDTGLFFISYQIQNRYIFKRTR